MNEDVGQSYYSITRVIILPLNFNLDLGCMSSLRKNC